jgi:hypothetical protein
MCCHGAGVSRETVRAAAVAKTLAGPIAVPGVGSREPVARPGAGPVAVRVAVAMPKPVPMPVQCRCQVGAMPKPCRGPGGGSGSAGAGGGGRTGARSVAAPRPGSGPGSVDTGPVAMAMVWPVKWPVAGLAAAVAVARAGDGDGPGQQRRGAGSRDRTGTGARSGLRQQLLAAGFVRDVGRRVGANRRSCGPSGAPLGNFRGAVLWVWGSTVSRETRRVVVSRETKRAISQHPAPALPR